MPKVYHVKAARKDNPRHGIKKGQPYYWWKKRPPGARSGYKVYSLTRPTRQQLTSSEFLSRCFDLEDALSNADLMPDDLDDICSSIRELGDEQEEKLQNMPDALQFGSTGELLQARKDACEAWADELEGVNTPDEVDEDDIEDEDLEAEGFDESEFEYDGDEEEEAESHREERVAKMEAARSAAMAKAIETKWQERLTEWREEITQCTSAAEAS